MGKMTKEAVHMDDIGRILLPEETRRRAGINPRSKLVVKVLRKGIIELSDFEEVTKNAQKIAVGKLAGWNEADHKESKLLQKLATRRT
jgi:bifunctional DNA-binding transcriptional regulator/antitoxin component of YhaV-PrlF toxin-antitoxin module